MKLGEEEGSLALDRERTRITKLLTDRKIIMDLTVLLMIFLYFPRRSRKNCEVNCDISNAGLVTAVEKS
jgi:hypothetical protein